MIVIDNSPGTEEGNGIREPNPEKQVYLTVTQ